MVMNELSAKPFPYLVLSLLFVIICFVLLISQSSIYLAKAMDLYSQQDPLVLDTSAESTGKFLVNSAKANASLILCWLLFSALPLAPCRI